jgi:hypothetical protein
VESTVWACLFVGVLLVGGYRQRASAPLRHVAARLLLVSLGARYSSLQESQPIVLIVFRPSDCPGSLSYLDAVLQWSAAKGLGVEGIVVGKRSDLGDVREVLRREQLALPLDILSPVDASVLLWRAGVRGLPAAVILSKEANPRSVTSSELAATTSH